MDRGHGVIHTDGVGFPTNRGVGPRTIMVDGLIHTDAGAGCRRVLDSIHLPWSDFLVMAAADLSDGYPWLLTRYSIRGGASDVAITSGIAGTPTFSTSTVSFSISDTVIA